MRSEKDRKVIIALILLGFTSCIGGGFARLLSNYIISSSWIESVVGLGIGGTLFFWGTLGIVWSKFAPGIARKIFSALVGTAGVVLGLVVLFSALTR